MILFIFNSLTLNYRVLTVNRACEFLVCVCTCFFNHCRREQLKKQKTSILSIYKTAHVQNRTKH